MTRLLRAPRLYGLVHASIGRFRGVSLGFWLFARQASDAKTPTDSSGVSPILQEIVALTCEVGGSPSEPRTDVRWSRPPERCLRLDLEEFGPNPLA